MYNFYPQNGQFGYGFMPQQPNQYPGFVPQQQNPVQTMNNNQSNTQFNNIIGHVVNSVDDITINEIAQDGSVSLFPTKDYSAIYAKAWTNNGTIQTIKFVPEAKPEVVSPENERNLSEEILSRLDRIEKAIPQGWKGNNQYNKKENAKNE